MSCRLQGIRLAEMRAGCALSFHSNNSNLFPVRITIFSFFHLEKILVKRMCQRGLWPLCAGWCLSSWALWSQVWILRRTPWGLQSRRSKKMTRTWGEKVRWEQAHRGVQTKPWWWFLTGHPAGVSGKHSWASLCCHLNYTVPDACNQVSFIHSSIVPKIKGLHFLRFT